MINQLEALSVDMGYKAPVFWHCYKVAIATALHHWSFYGRRCNDEPGPAISQSENIATWLRLLNSVFFATVLGALALNYFGIIEFTLPQAASIGIIGGADGPDCNLSYQ